MTIAAEPLKRSWLWGLQSGTASALSSLFARKDLPTQPATTKAARPAYMHVSPGVSASARLIEDRVDGVIGEIDHWLTLTLVGAEEVEQDLVVLLPPNRQYVSNVEIISWERPGLLIDPDDFLNSTTDIELVG